MAVKESSQRAIIDQQFIQIADLQKAIHKLNSKVSRIEALLTKDTCGNSSIDLCSMCHVRSFHHEPGSRGAC
jgi:hypothetical protein